LTSTGQDFPDASAPGDITTLLRAWGNGDCSALNRVFPELYAELDVIAERVLNKLTSGNSTLNSAALVNEAYMRLIESKSPLWQNRGHFFAFASTMIRGILVDHLRSRRALKRGGDLFRITLQNVGMDELGVNPELLDLDTALKALGSKWPRAATAVDLRFFGGFSESETASALGCSVPTIRRDMKFARAWIQRRLTGSIPGET